MPRTDAPGRIKRLELLAVQLKQDGHLTVRDLAQHHGVSVRTIARDLALMRDQGIQIDADRGRGGGVRLAPDWGVGRMNLTYGEAVDLLIGIAVAEQMNSPMFLANLGAVRRQLVASFSAKKRTQVDRIKSRIFIGVTASTYVQQTVSAPPRRVVQALHQTFIDKEALNLRYQREDGAKSTRVIEPHYLMLKYPVWYVVAYDHLRAAARTFRCDRILSAQKTGTPFTLRPKHEFQSILEDASLDS